MDVRFRYLAAFTKRRDLSLFLSLQGDPSNRALFDNSLCVMKDVCTMKVRPVLCLFISISQLFLHKRFILRDMSR